MTHNSTAPRSAPTATHGSLAQKKGATQRSTRPQRDSGTRDGRAESGVGQVTEKHSANLRDMTANGTKPLPPAPRVVRNRIPTTSTTIDDNDDVSHGGGDGWQYTEEPHASRRREILLQHPEIKQLMGPDPRIAYIVTGQLAAQIFFCWLLQDASWPAIFVLAYVISTTFNQSMGVAMHEMGHNLAFGHARGWMNRVLAIWTNLPLVVPMAITFKKYHADHHRYLGEGVVDTDVPARFETRFFHHPLTKLLWMVLHPVFYGVRPFYKNPKPPSGWEVVNALCQLAFDGLVVQVFGVKALVYLLFGTVFGLSLHPLASHYFSEHYFLAGRGPTHSYYGPLNWVLFNAGYHNEHHDFPYVPYSRLPEVRRLAPEFYDHLPHHTSWVKVMWDFLFDPKVAPHASGEGY